MTEIVTLTNALILAAGCALVFVVSYYLYELFRFKGPRARVKGNIPLDAAYVRRTVDEILVPVIEKEIHITGAKKRRFKADGPKFDFFFNNAYDIDWVRSMSHATWVVPLYNIAGSRRIGCITPSSIYVFGERISREEFKNLLEEACREYTLNDYLQELAAEFEPPSEYKRSHGIETSGFGDRQETMVEWLTSAILNSTVRRKIIVQRAHSDSYMPQDNGRFLIHLGTAPEAVAHLPTYKTQVNNQPYPGGTEDTVRSPTAKGDILFDDNGVAYGEIIGRNLYFYQPIIEHGSYRECRFYAEALNQAREMMEAENQGDEAKATAFAKECLGLTEACQTDCSEDDASTALQTVLDKTRRQEQHLFRMEANSDIEAGKEFDALLALDKVIDVTVDNDKVVVSTKTLYCEDPRSNVLHEIGAFDIVINQRSNSVTWHNRTRQVAGGNGNMHAPHVGPEGNACFGNTSELFPNLIRKRDFATCAMMAIVFVESVNIDDSWGKYISNWPKADPSVVRGRR